MQISNQTNTTSALLGASGSHSSAVTGSGSGSAPRFDLTLLQLTRQILDSKGAKEDGLVPEKVRKALESALAELSDLSKEQLNALGSDVKIKAALIGQATQDFGLSISQQAQLEKLLDLSMGQMGMMSGQLAGRGVNNEAPSVANSGPKGGTTETPHTTENNDIRTMNLSAAAAVQGPASFLNQSVQNSAPAVLSSRTSEAGAIDQAEASKPGNGGATSEGSKALVLSTLKTDQGNSKTGQEAGAQGSTGGTGSTASIGSMFVAGTIQGLAGETMEILSDVFSQGAGSVGAEKQQVVSGQVKSGAGKDGSGPKLEPAPFDIELVGSGALQDIVPGSEVFVDDAGKGAGIRNDGQTQLQKLTLPTAIAGQNAETTVPQRMSATKRWLAGSFGPEALTGLGGLGQGSVGADGSVIQDGRSEMNRQFNLRESVFQQTLSALSDAAGENSQIKIRLKPDSLGTLDVSLNIEGGKLTARLLASSAEVRDVFAANLQQFKQSLEARGMQVTQLSVAVRAETGTQGQAGQRQPQPQAGPPLVVPSIPNLSAAESAFSGLVGADMNAQRFSALA